MDREDCRDCDSRLTNNKSAGKTVNCAGKVARGNAMGRCWLGTELKRSRKGRKLLTIRIRARTITCNYSNPFLNRMH